MRAPPPRRLASLLFGFGLGLALASCTPGPTDPDGPIVHNPEPITRAAPPRLAALVDVAVAPAPQCHACGGSACIRSTAGDVCLVQCSGSGVRRWDLGVLGDGQCDPTAYNFCDANGLGRVTDFCWGGYS